MAALRALVVARDVAHPSTPSSQWSAAWWIRVRMTVTFEVRPATSICPYPGAGARRSAARAYPARDDRAPPWASTIRPPRRLPLRRRHDRGARIETSCDETSAAVLEGAGDSARVRRIVLRRTSTSCSAASFEIASRAHLTSIVPVVGVPSTRVG
jgi:hypothetical protein